MNSEGLPIKMFGQFNKTIFWSQEKMQWFDWRRKEFGREGAGSRGPHRDSQVPALELGQCSGAPHVSLVWEVC